jgi:cytochrome c-type biogenesis protein CcmH
LAGKDTEMTHLIAALLIASALTPTPNQQKTIVKLENRLMAPCCYSQTIREHMSAEAEQMREEVVDMVVAGKSKQEIIKYYKTKYGETILVVPDAGSGQIAFGVPVAVGLSALALLAFGILRTVHKRIVPETASSPNLEDRASPALLARIRREVDDKL